MATNKITDATVEPLTLAQAKAHLREDLVDAANDQLIEGLITVARQTVEDRLQRTLLPTTWMRTLSGFTRGCIVLEKPPIISVEWVKYVAPDGVLTLLDSAAYELDPASAPGILLPAHGMCWPETRVRPGAVRVQYKAGYGETPAAIPAPIVQWIKLALTDLYENRSRSSDRPVVPQGFADGLIQTYEVWSV